MSDRASLEAEQEFLLISLDDLERELLAGDLGRSDYEELKKDYTVRTARVARQLRSLDRPASALLASGKPGSSVSKAESSSRRWLWIVGLAFFGVAAGWLLSISAGERGVNDQITGSVEETPRQQVLRCQQMGQDPAMLVDSFECFDEVLERDPENVEAMAYRGWYGVLASGSAQQVGQDDLAEELLLSAGIYLSRAVTTDPTYPDARAFRMVVLERLGQTEAACADYAVLAEINPPGMIGGLVAPVAERMSC